MATKLKFYDEIPSITRLGRRKAFVEQLKERPHKWAEYPPPKGKERHCPVAASILQTSFPGVEAATRDGKVYARWVGDRRR